jgi:4-amino-4-deoxy-L-arabinose transferase-like glycosyltransferase
MPMLLPLSLLATASIDSLKRSTASAFNWFGILTFGMAAGVLWVGWVAMMTGHPQYFAAKIHHYHPEFSAHFRFSPFVLALFVTLLWMALAFRTEHNGRRSVLNWAGGVVMVWTLLMTLWLPFLDSVKGYREMFMSMKSALPAKYGCIEGRHLGGAQRAMLDYYLGIDTQRDKTCKLVLVQTVSSNRHKPEGLEKLWEGARAGDRHERYRLYVRKKGAE